MKYSRNIFLIISMVLGVASLYANSIGVNTFSKVKKKGVELSKKEALISLKCPEDGFVFNIKETKFETKKVGDAVQFFVPDGSRYFTISHETHGSVNWKIPLKNGVKKKSLYEGEIVVSGETVKEYKIDHQWLVVECNPLSALLKVDSTYYRVDDGRLQLYLPLGKHALQAVSPFYEPLTDSLDLVAEKRLDYQVVLNPIYSFLTVDSQVEKARVLIDGKECGVTPFRSYKLVAGSYDVELKMDGYLSQKQSIELEPRRNHLLQFSLVEGVDAVGKPHHDSLASHTVSTTAKSVEGSREVPTKIKAFDESSEIWINRQKVGQGEWNGVLKEGFYTISTSRDFYSSKPQYIWVTQQKSLEVNLSTPLLDYGSLNIESNEIGSTIYINGVVAGRSPMVIPYLPLDSKYLIRLEAEGCKAQERWVTLKSNDMIDLKFELK